MKRRLNERMRPCQRDKNQRNSRPSPYQMTLLIRRLCAAALCICLLLSLPALSESPLTIVPGEESDRVRQLQQALTSLGYSCGTIDGKYGTATENAVRRFQKDNRLNVDGLAGQTTQNLLYQKLNDKNATPTPSPAPAEFLPHQVFRGDYATLMQGSSGQRVTVLQSALRTLGYYAQTVDGRFGLGTYRAVVAYQKSKKLKADGLAGKATLRKIEDGLLALSQNAAPQITAAPEVTAAPQETTLPGQTTLFGGDYTTITKGTKGIRVITLQAALEKLGYSAGKIDGNFGLSTYNALVLFQKNQRLTADGLAGRTTLKRMEALLAAQAPAPTATPAPVPTQTPAPDGLFGGNYATLSMGAVGERITLLQTALRQLGYYTGKVDGTFGQGTQQAVMTFQADQSLKADGMAGKTTLRKIESVLAAAPTSPPSQTDPPQLTDAPQATSTPAPQFGLLQMGAVGEAVSRLQQALKNLSYPVDVTGTYDAITKAAVEAFQKLNRLTPDGIAGEKTQEKLYSGSAAAYQGDAPTLSPDVGTFNGPSTSEVQLLHWQDDIKPAIRTGQQVLVYDPATRLAWTLKLYSLGRHADCEPLTATDTAVMYKAFGNQYTWNQKGVYVRLPSGTWTVAATHDMPHLSGSIKDNNFDGHLCVHFLRDMKEAQQNDPSYGVANQRTIRALWKQMTGQDVVEKVRE